MILSRRQFLLYAFKTFDLTVVIFSFAMATFISRYPIPVEKLLKIMGRIFSMQIRLKWILLFIGFLFVWHIIFNILGLYRSMRFSSRSKEAEGVLKAASFGSLVLIGATFLFEIKLITPVFIAVFWGVSTVTTLLGRFVMRSILRYMRIHDRNLRFILIAGTNKRAMQFAQSIESRKELGYRITGFIDDDWQGMRDFEKLGYSLASNFNDFPLFIRNNVVDEIVICLPIKSFYDRIASVIRVCEEQGITIRILPDMFDLKLERIKAERFEREFLVLYTGNMEGGAVLTKRFLDLFVSSFLLLILAPLFFLITILIKATSPGPILFVQKRIGLNKRIFNLYKFRTMVPNAEQQMKDLEHLNEAEGPVFKIKKDPRVTPIGKILRKTSMDELPQFLNVLKGDMSLVGPRPLPVRDFNGFNKDWHRRRFSVRPGITCLWQVNGRSNLTFEKWMDLDMEYIDQWSLWLDIEILAKTAYAVLRMSGAS